MTFTLIDGKHVASVVKDNLKIEIDKIENAPGLGVILVGDRKDSMTYVRMKKRACAQVGINSFEVHETEDMSEDNILKHVLDMNNNKNIHGILVQLPLPDDVNEQRILSAISPEKDVDGLGPKNIAHLCTRKIDECVQMHTPCTPQGCIYLLDYYKIEIAGKNAVVLGRSNIVGIPVAMMLMQRDATVTICHSKTVDMKEIVQKADIVIAAMGKPEMITAEWIKPGATVIDVGITSVDDPDAKRGYRLVGDCDFNAVKSVAGAATPVPNGVGPMTIAMLLSNTFESFVRATK